MASVVFSGSGLSAAVGRCPIGMFRVELLLNKARYEGYRVFKVVHYKEKTAIGHEFFAVYLRKGSELVLIRIERRPGARRAASSSDFWSDDSISQLHPYFDFHELYHICTVFCEEEKQLTVLQMCDICTFVRNLAPIYSVTKTKHCYWFCAAFLVQLHALGYSTPPLERGKDYERRGRFGWDWVNRQLITEDAVKQQLTASTSRATGRRAQLFLFPSFITQLRLTPRRDNKPWSRIAEFTGHTNIIYASVYTPDGRHILSCSWDGTIRTWDVFTGLEVRHPLRGHNDAVLSLSVSRDGRSIVSASTDRTMCIWDLEAGVPITEPLRGHSSAVCSVAFSPDGRKVVSGSEDGSVRIWDAQTGTAIRELVVADGEDWTYSVAWSPDGNYIAAGSSDCTIRRWDAEAGTPFGDSLRGHDDAVLSICFSPDGSRIVSGSSDKTIRLWDTVAGKALCQPLLGHTDAVTCVDCSHDGSWIASGSLDNTVCVWDSRAGSVPEPEGAQFAAGSKIFSVAWSPVANNVAAGGWGGKILVFGQVDVTRQSLSQRIRTRLKELLPATSCTSIQQWDASGELVGHEDSVYSVCFTPDGENIISGSLDLTIRIWNAVDVGNTSHPPLTGHSSTVKSVAVSPDGQRIVSADMDGTVRIWDLKSGTLICPPLANHTGGVQLAVFSPDGCKIASASDDHTIRLWDARTGAPIGEPLKGHHGSVWAAAWSLDGKHILSGALDRTIRVWDVATGAQIGEPLLGNMDRVNSISVSSDGSCFVSGSGDGSIRLWDAMSRRQVGEPLYGHQSYIWRVVFSPDGCWIASASGDGTVRIWDSKPGGTGEVARLSTGGPEATSVAWSPAGNRIAVGSDDGKVRMWHRVSA